MIKLLVDINNLDQRIIEVDRSGSYHDAAKVLWDERFDGLFPSNLLASVGGLIRQGSNLVVDAAKLAAYEADLAAKATVETQRSTRVQNAIDLLRGDLSGTLTTAQLSACVRALVIVLRDLSKQL